MSAAPAPAPYMDARRTLASRFIAGEGLEIGPLHQPMWLGPRAQVRYVDRMAVADLRREYPELRDWDLTEADIVDDGEKLTKIADGSQDFIVANHFLEHTENPIATIETHFAKLRPGGVLFYAVPDKRFTFDFRREPTALAHMVADYEEGPERSRSEHYEQWTRHVIVEEWETEAELTERAAQLEADAYSIHMHVWTQAEFLELILEIRRRLGNAFDIEAAARQEIEFIVVLRKEGEPSVPPPPPPRPPATRVERAQRILRAARNEWRHPAGR